MCDKQVTESQLDRFHLGVIEGFYGHCWSWDLRCDYAQFLSSAGYQSYIYAPKSDAWLRRQWQSHWPGSMEREVRRMARAYAQAGLSWGIGLSPFELYSQWPGKLVQQLRAKIRYLCQFSPDILLIAFDDMRGDQAGLARLQCEIMDCVLEESSAVLHLFCPTYYSHDPVLEQVFGVMPEHYWQELGERLAPTVQTFWTGNNVCSHRYSPGDFTEISRYLQRKPVLWDNYPVNDGKKTSPFLHLDAFRQRPASLCKVLSAHYVNPMNAASLSKLPLLTLPQSYRQAGKYDADCARAGAFRAICSDQLADRLEQDWQTFQTGGLNALDEETRARLRQIYSQWQEPVAREIVLWLDGYYQFDPACLTG